MWRATKLSLVINLFFRSRQANTETFGYLFIDIIIFKISIVQFVEHIQRTVHLEYTEYSECGVL
jgi:hypothetical protein